MQISVIIPFYNSPLDSLFDLLASIRMQLAAPPIEVIIVNDGGTPVADEFMAIFAPLKIRQINLQENGGPGIARQAGIDAAQGDFLMFCDADDVIYNVGAISQLVQTIGDADILISAWMEEISDEHGTMHYIPHMNDRTWMHGKLFRASYLKEHNIRHHPDLRVHEDSYFFGIASAYGGKITVCNNISYVWRWQPGSITRADGCAYTFRSAPIFEFGQSEVCRLMEAINAPDIMERVVDHVCYIYWMSHIGEWVQPDHTGDRAALWTAFKKYFGPYLHYWDEAPLELKEQLYEAVRNNANAPSLVCGENIFGWVERMRT